MERMTRVKLVLAVAGIGLFLAGVRMDLPRIRLAGIAVVAVAFILRLAKVWSDRATETPDEEETAGR